MATNLDFYAGKTVTFLERIPDIDPETGVEQAHTLRRLRGVVMEATQVEPYGPGKIPNHRLMVKGSSGKQVVVDVVAQRVRFL